LHAGTHLLVVWLRPSPGRLIGERESSLSRLVPPVRDLKPEVREHGRVWIGDGREPSWELA
jgi:hypothetical protein